MSVVKSLLLGMGGAAVMATGLAGTANAHVVAAGAGACEVYAREYAAVHAPQFGLFGWNAAYRHGYNACLAGGPDFVSVSPVGYNYNYGYSPFAAPIAFGANVAGAAVNAGATVAGAAINAGASLAGAALSIPGAILGGTAAALTPPVAEPVVSPTAAPVVTKNYRGTYETVAVDASLTSTAALAVPETTVAVAAGTPEWHAYCAAKYRSYDPDTGMYLAYSGTYRMCN